MIGLSTTLVKMYYELIPAVKEVLTACLDKFNLISPWDTNNINLQLTLY